MDVTPVAASLLFRRTEGRRDSAHETQATSGDSPAFIAIKSGLFPERSDFARPGHLPEGPYSESFIRFDERDRIARELHDSTSQLLVALELQLMRLKRLPPGTDTPAFQEVMDELGTTLSDLHDNVRSIGHAEPIDSSKLSDQLEAMARKLAMRTQVRIETHISKLPRSMSPRVAAALHAITQEALANALRHADAHNISISLESSRRLIRLSIADGGAGLKDSPSRSPGSGIRNMKARAREVGGVFSLSNREPGAVAEVTIDLDEEASL